MTSRDQVYAQRSDKIADFVFDDTVAEVFPDMLARSIPGYAAILNMIQLLTAEYAQPNTHLYDLGCSLGGASVAMLAGLEVEGCELIGVDNSPSMIERVKGRVRSDRAGLQWLQQDLQATRITNASVVVLNFTLQFLPVDDRLAVLKRIAEGLRPGGVLILSEKIAGPDKPADDLLVTMYHAFKQANGYSELEIAQKRTALENVMIPETVSDNCQRLEQAGFKRVDQWFQCFNFASFVAHV